MWFLVFSGPSADEQRILIPEAANLGSGTTVWGVLVDYWENLWGLRF